MSKYPRNRVKAIEQFLKKEEFLESETDRQNVQEMNEIMKDHRQRGGILRKERLELINEYFEDRINNIIMTG